MTFARRLNDFANAGYGQPTSGFASLNPALSEG
jgi:hypothetical protein